MYLKRIMREKAKGRNTADTYYTLKRQGKQH